MAVFTENRSPRVAIELVETAYRGACVSVRVLGRLEPYSTRTGIVATVD